MAIMMAALALAGVSVGPRMLGEDIALTYLLGATVVAANLIAIPLFFMAVPWIVRFSAVRREMIAPFAIVIGVTASLIHEPNLITHVELLVATALGLALKAAKWPRAPFILGFVVGDLLEASSYQTAVIWGWSALARPMTIVLALALVAWVAYLLRRKKQREASVDHPDKSGAILPIAIFALAVLAELMATRRTASRCSRSAPPAWSCRQSPCCGRASHGSTSERWHAALRLAGRRYLLANPIIGLTASSGIFLALMLQALRIRLVPLALAVLGFIGLQLLLLSLVFDIGIERDILGRGLWWLLGR